MLSVIRSPARMLRGVARHDPIPEAAPDHIWSGPLGGVLVVYLLLSTVAAMLLPVPEVVRAALALPALALIPLLVGSALLRLLPVFDQISALD